MYQDYTYRDPGVQEYLEELYEEGLTVLCDELIYKSFLYLLVYNNLSDLEKINFIDFYESLDDEMKVKIQFHNALKKVLEYNFLVQKEDRKFVIQDELNKKFDRFEVYGSCFDEYEI